MHREKRNRMAHLATDLLELYKTYFQQPYCVNIERLPEDSVFTSRFKGDWQGVEVFLPVTLRAGGSQLYIPCCTIRAASKKSVVRTVLPERLGTVKEQFQTGDWEFTVKGVLIAANGVFPDEEILALRRIYEATEQAELENALSDLFLDTTRLVCVTSLEFPEVEGRNNRHRPFTLVCESDYVTTLRIYE